jgi:hypothetical protein
LLQLAKDVLTNPLVKTEFDLGQNNKNRIWAWADNDNATPNPILRSSNQKPKISKVERDTKKNERDAKKVERNAKKTLKAELIKRRQLVRSEFRQRESELLEQFEKNMRNLRLLKKARLDEIHD